jgi:[ribosomal protein S18]-alanine N-acetyltransferase
LKRGWKQSSIDEKRKQIDAGNEIGRNRGMNMTYHFEKMTQKEAEEIAYDWHYDGEYAFYNMEADEEDLTEFLDPQSRGETVFTVHKAEEVAGFISACSPKNGVCEIGLGMRPDLTGNGMGSGFLKAGLSFVINEFKPGKITLSVAAFNKRAIKVYEKNGFTAIDTFMQNTNGGTYEFLRMEYNVEKMHFK